MKALLVVLLICILFISLDCTPKVYDTKIFISTYPKKFNTTLQKSIQLVNSRKFGKLGAIQNNKISIKKSVTKKTKKSYKEYTVFPPITEIKLNHDLYNQGELERKPRVKKISPEHGIILLRKKRSGATQFNNTNVKVAGKKKIVKRRKNIKKRIKRIGSNKILRNSTSKRNKAKFKPKNIKTTHVNKTKGKNSSKTRSATIKRNKNTSRDLKYTTKPKNRNFQRDNTKKIDTRKLKQEKKNTRKQKVLVRNRRLIAGRDAMIQDYPYVVSIQKDDRHWCAGALLNPRLVITTANCMWKAKRLSRMRVRAGTRYMDRGGQLVKIQEVVKHPKWSIRSLPDNDVALLLLNKNIKFSDSVHAVDLPNRAMWPAFEDVWVTSWGAERRDGIFTSVGVTLKVYHAMLLNHEKCNNVTMRFGVAVTENFICVAQTGRRAPCTRDTGAPAVSDGILWGVASWGIRRLCGTERYPAMFSYLASRSNLDFITNATHYLMSDKRYYPFGDRFVVHRADTTATAATTTFI